MRHFCFSLTCFDFFEMENLKPWIQAMRLPAYGIVGIPLALGQILGYSISRRDWHIDGFLVFSTYFVGLLMQVNSNKNTDRQKH